MSQEDMRNELFERNDRRNAGDRGQETQEEKSHRLHSGGSGSFDSWFLAVSYTHLDVYKRQQCTCA